MIHRRLLSVAAVLLVLTLAIATAAQSAGKTSRSAKGTKALLGIFDEGQTLYGNPDYAFSVLHDLNTQVVRSHLYWGGKYGVARSRPANPTDPNDPAYDWTLYDREVQYASQYGIKVIFSIYGTPSWANGGKGLNAAPTNAKDLQQFAEAAAKKFPIVKYWLAWNEPNSPVFLKPQYVKKRVRVKGKLTSQWVIQSAIDYAKICNAVYAGVKATHQGQLVGCGVTDPQGNNRPTASRAAPTPIPFMEAAKKAGLKTFDAWAHHPYPGSPSQSPTTKPKFGAIGLGNIDVLIKEVTKLWGKKAIWLTEYGYQTKPQDPTFGVSYAAQAKYLTEAWNIVRANPRIGMLIWFIFQDDTNIKLGWQSGLLTYTGVKKPAYQVFKTLPRG
ncbi:MAG: cellulase family glycosylhydrolase [Gaiellaceae bacterium]